MNITDERRMKFILDHLMYWKMVRREPSARPTEPKNCVLLFNPYEKTGVNAAQRFVYLGVLDGLIMREEAKIAAEAKDHESAAMLEEAASMQTLFGILGQTELNGLLEPHEIKSVKG